MKKNLLGRCANYWHDFAATPIKKQFYTQLRKLHIFLTSKFFCHSFCNFWFSSSSISASLFRFLSSWSRSANSRRFRSISAKSFMVRTYTACLYFAGSSSGIVSLPSFFAFFRFSFSYKPSLSSLANVKNITKLEEKKYLLRPWIKFSITECYWSSRPGK